MLNIDRKFFAWGPGSQEAKHFFQLWPVAKSRILYREVESRSVDLLTKKSTVGIRSVDQFFRIKSVIKKQALVISPL